MNGRAKRSQGVLHMERSASEVVNSNRARRPGGMEACSSCRAVSTCAWRMVSSVVATAILRKICGANVRRSAGRTNIALEIEYDESSGTLWRQTTELDMCLKEIDSAVSDWEDDSPEVWVYSGLGNRRSG